MESLLDNGHQHIHRYGNPDLRLHGILGRAIELLDTQVLLDPLEKQFDLPASLVQGADRRCRWAKQVGEKDQGLSRLGILETNTPKENRKILLRVKPRQFDCLVADNPFGTVAWRGIHPPEIHIRFGAGDEESARLMKPKKPREIQIGAIHDIDRRRLRNQKIEGVDIVEFSVGHMKKAGNTASQA